MLTAKDLPAGWQYKDGLNYGLIFVDSPDKTLRFAIDHDPNNEALRAVEYYIVGTGRWNLLSVVNDNQEGMNYIATCILTGMWKDLK